MPSPVRNISALLIFSCLFGTTVQSSSRQQVLDDYQNGISPNWQTKSFAGQTRYTVEKSAGRSYLKATSSAAASGLFYEIEYDPREKPLLKWSWKIDHTIKKGDARSKEGDDYAARVYVIFPSLLFWNTRALNYVWANRLPKGEAVPNAYTGNAMMIAVESGEALAGQWLNEERNIYEDFRRYFGSEPPKVGAIAIMTDTDNTRETVTACYGPIIIATPE